VRVLQLNNYADPVGGAEVYALALTRELRERGHVVGFFGTHPDQETDEELLRVVRRPRYDAGVLFADPRVRVALEGTLQRFRPQLIHVHNVWSLGLDVLAALGTAAVPIVHTVHDFNLLCPNSWCVWGDGTPCPGGVGVKCTLHGCEANYPFDAPVALHTLIKQRLLCSLVDVALCPSRHLAELMRNHGSREVRHLNYFIDPIPLTPRPREPRQLVYIGRLEREKGVDTLLEAMVTVSRAAPDTTLTVIGGGSQAAALEQRARQLGLSPSSVSFRRQVPRDELGSYYAGATACVLSSIWTENSPLVAYECLSAGLPMIASRIGGIPELAEDGVCGLTFTPRDAADLATQILRFLELPAARREQMSTTMRERALAYQVPRHLERIEALYAELAARPATPRALPPLTVDADLRLFLERAAVDLTGLEGPDSRVSFDTLCSRLRHEQQQEARRPVRRLRGWLTRLGRALHLPRVFRG